jgi:membrane protein
MNEKYTSRMVKKMWNRVTQKYPVLAAWTEKFKKITPPGFEGIPIYDVAVIFRKEIQNDALNTRASSISYFFILAMFPTIFSFFTLLAYIPIHDFEEVLMSFLHDAMPHEVYLVLESTIRDIVGKQRGGLLSLNFLLTVVFASEGVVSMMQAFDKINPTFKKRSWLQKRGTSLKIIALVSFQIIFTIALFIMGNEFLHNTLDFLHINFWWTYLLFQGLRYFLILFFIFNVIAVVYYYAPAVKEKYRYFSVGATFATLLSFITTYIFSWYIGMLHNFNTLYGSLGIIIVVMLWVNINALVLLFGFELNNSIAINKEIRRNNN